MFNSITIIFFLFNGYLAIISDGWIRTASVLLLPIGAVLVWESFQEKEEVE